MIHLIVIGRTGQLASELQQLPLPPGWRLTSTDRQTLDLMRPELFAAVLQGLKPDLINKCSRLHGGGSGRERTGT